MTTSFLPQLDKSRDFGIIAGHFEDGDPMFGAAWSQDGFLFNIAGELIETALSPKDRARLDELIERNAAMDAARAAFLQIAPNTDPAMLDKIITTEAINRQPDSAEITKEDLVDWAFGRKSFNYGKVAKAFRDHFAMSQVNKQQGLEILAQHGLIPALNFAPTIPAAQ